MRLISGLGLAARLTLGFGAIMVLLLGMAALSVLRMQELTQTLEEITVRNADRSRAVNLLGRGVADYVQVLGNLGSTDLEGAAAVLGKIQSTLTDYDKAQVTLLGLLPQDAHIQALVETIGHRAQEARELIALGDKLAEGRGVTAQAFQVVDGQ